MTSRKPTDNMPDSKKTFAETVKLVVIHYLIGTTILAVLAVIGIFFINPKASWLTGAAMVSILIPAYQTAFDSGWNTRLCDLPKGKRINLICTLIGMVVTAISFLAGTSTLFVC
ncbi:hypothetical protein AAG587_17725 [Vreelandella neptunia]|uniref:hypothetical protein n=1 Tax=Vreelandella neptunia TaxID=115551 RepID=UPI00315AF408